MIHLAETLRTLGPTLWASVADLSHKIYAFQSTKSANLFWVDLNKVNLAEGAPVVDVDAYDLNLSGDISDKLKPSSIENVAPNGCKHVQRAAKRQMSASDRGQAAARYSDGAR